jgi:RNA polymerase sigma-70 factor (ECF subfamily)
VAFNLFKQPYTDRPDEELMRLVGAARDQRAFGILYDRYSRKLLSFCTRILGNREQAEDTIQEVFMKLINNPASFDTSRTFSTWIFTIAHNLCLNQLRNQNNRDRLIRDHYEQSESAEPYHTLDEKLVRQQIGHAFKELSEKEQTIFVLRFEHELGVKDIAEIMGIPEGSVKSGLYYMLKKIDLRLQPFKTTY